MRNRILTILMLLLSVTLPTLCFAQTQRNGRVTQEDTGEPLEGATVIIKGTARATVTSEDGKFSIMANNNEILVISRVGEETVEVSVGNRVVINVSLRVAATGGDEVIVTGYRTMKKIDFTGAVSQVKGEDLAKAPVANFSQALEGRVPGLQVQFTDGQPGEVPTFIMRGAGSLTNSTQPLFIVDGFQMTSFDPASVNVDDIESVSFLKDAASVAQYGSRAANGVVIITSKRGRLSRPVITLNGNYGFNSNRKKIEIMSPYEFLKINMEWTPTDPDLLLYFANGKKLEDYKDVKGIDFQDYMYTKGKVQRYNLSVRGGTDMTQYLISGSYFNQEGSIINTGSSSYTGKITMDNKITEKFKINFTADFSNTGQRGPVVREGGALGTSNTLMYRVWAWRPLPFPTENVDDYLEQTVDQSAVSSSDFRVNPITDYQNQHLRFNSKTLSGNLALIYEIKKNLIIKSTLIDRYNFVNNEFFYNDKTSLGMVSARNAFGPYGGVSEGRGNAFTNENIVTYSPRLGEHNKLVILAVQGIQTTDSKGTGFYSNAFPFQQLGIYGIDLGIPYSPSSYRSQTSRVWYLGSLDYGYKSKYMLRASLRSEGSSQFVGNNVWGYFPSVSGAWNMEKESFIKSIPVISTSKLRFSYGVAGNDRVPVYTPYEKLAYSTNTYPFNNQVTSGSVYNLSPINPDVRWETTQTIDFGYELGLFKDRVKMEIGVYRRRTKDLLYNATLPPTSGYTSAFKNIGSLENKGLEFELNTINVKRKDFEWRTNFNIYFNRNKILVLDNGLRTLLLSTPFEASFNNMYTNMIGQPTGMMMGYVFDGLYSVKDFYNPAPNVYILKEGIPLNGGSSVAPGYLKYKDFNGDGQITPADMTIIGRGQPIHTGGFSNTLRYKGISLYALFSWAYGNNVYNANRHTFEGNSNARPYINQFASYANRWTFENQNSDIQRSAFVTGGKVNYYTSQYVEDGSFLRLKTLNLDYALPVSWIKRAGMSSLNIFFSAQNVFTWTKYSGLDPQVSIYNQVLAPGFDYSAYPPARTYVFGTKIVF